MNVHVVKTVPVKKGTVKLLKNDKSRVKEDLQARFCERLAGETPACLRRQIYKDWYSQTEILSKVKAHCLSKNKVLH